MYIKLAELDSKCSEVRRWHKRWQAVCDACERGKYNKDISKRLIGVTRGSVAFNARTDSVVDYSDTFEIISQK